MPSLTSDQLTSIAQQIHDISVAVAQFRLNNVHDGASLSDPKIVQLLGLQISLANASSSFFIQAAQVNLADADAAAAQITSATTAANDALKRLTTIDKVINIASAAGVLAASIMTGNMSQIATASQGVFGAING